jgi:hypothetical protein
MTIIEYQFAWLEELITSMATQKLEEEKAITSSSMGVPTYSRLDPSLGFFCGVGFVGSTNVLHDAHVLGAKHRVTFFIHLKWIHQPKLHIPSHMFRNHEELMRDLTLKGGRLGAMCIFPNQSHWLKQC